MEIFQCKMETNIIEFREFSIALSVPLVHSFSGIFGFWGLVLLRSFTRQDWSPESINPLDSPTSRTSPIQWMNGRTINSLFTLWFMIVNGIWPSPVIHTHKTWAVVAFVSWCNKLHLSKKNYKISLLCPKWNKMVESLNVYVNQCVDMMSFC